MNMAPAPSPQGSPDRRPAGRDVRPGLWHWWSGALHCAPLYSTRYPPSTHLGSLSENSFGLLSCENTLLYFTNRKNLSNGYASTALHHGGSEGTPALPRSGTREQAPGRAR